VARTFLGRRNYSTDTKGIAVLEMATSGVMNVFGSASPSQTDWFALDGCHYDL
jgi:hypothetical protein